MSWKWNWDSRYEHEIPYSWLNAEGDDCANVSWKWNWDSRYEHEIPHFWLNAEGDDCANVLWMTDVELGLQIRT